MKIDLKEYPLGDLMDPLHTKAECFTYLLRTLIKPFRFYDEQ